MLRVQRTNVVLADNERWASSATERIRGLRGQPPIQPGHALIIPRARQVHTFGMTYPIDVIFCDASWKVRHVAAVVQPGRISKWVWGAYYAIELPAGRAGDVVVGDRLDHSLSDR